MLSSLAVLVDFDDSLKHLKSVFLCMCTVLCCWVYVAGWHKIQRFLASFRPKKIKLSDGRVQVQSKLFGWGWNGQANIREPCWEMLLRRHCAAVLTAVVVAHVSFLEKQPFLLALYTCSQGQNRESVLLYTQSGMKTGKSLLSSALCTLFSLDPQMGFCHVTKNVIGKHAKERKDSTQRPFWGEEGTEAVRDRLMLLLLY